MLRQCLRDLLVTAARWVGNDIVDSVTGKKIGRALLLPWRGRILVIGLDATVSVHFLPQKRLTYWKQDLGFRAAERPDFPHEPGA